MGDWPAPAEQGGIGTWVISPGHHFALGPGMNSIMGGGSITSSTAWPSANRAILIPFRLPRRATVYQAVVGSGATATGNFDVGVYDALSNRIVSSGATAKGNSVETVVNLTDTVIGPGLYYMALAANGTNNYVATTSASAAFLKLMGVRQASSSYTLPDPITMETVASAFLPGFSIWLRST